jgi:transposase
MTIADVIAAQTGHDGTVATQNGPRAGQSKRRTFTAEYKLRVLNEYENAESPDTRPWPTRIKHSLLVGKVRP